jgi:hypothetical protein
MAEIDYELKIAETRAKLEKLKAQKSKNERAIDTRRKIIAGALILEIMKKDKDIALVVAEEMQKMTSAENFALLDISAQIALIRGKQQ